ncbi:MAG: HAD family hydrolase [Paenirhodobacter sp.]|uniref:HAD family hydrolase n=1 Tax=Paenirhodobacter sp. TaxID=1965326 RepID=UPI003D0F7E72
MTAFAFFDVDETLVSEKTMFTILAAIGEEIAGLDPAGVIATLHEMRDRGMPRSEVNRQFYRALKGLDRAQVREIAARHVAARLAQIDRPFLIPGPNDLLVHLRARGLRPVFVSGSAVDFLEPIARALGVTEILATRLEEVGGVYTGEIAGRCMIGAGKREAVLEFMAARHAVLADCHGVGDHLSDAEFLSIVGHAHMVRGSAEAEALAARNGWQLVDPGFCTEVAA